MLLRVLDELTLAITETYETNHIHIHFIFIYSCSDQTGQDDFFYDPTIPYPILNSGDFWLDKFDERGLQNARLYDDQLFCNTIDIGGDNYLYCFDLQSGTVKWRALVGSYATQSITKINDTIIYCFYLGEIQAFDVFGKELWKTKYDKSYAGHWIDPSNAKIKIKDVIGYEIRIYHLNSKVDTIIQSPSLKKKITKLGNKVDQIKKHYSLKYNGWNYHLDVSTKGNEELHKIEIKKYR